MSFRLSGGLLAYFSLVSMACRVVLVGLLALAWIVVVRVCRVACILLCLKKFLSFCASNGIFWLVSVVLSVGDRVRTWHRMVTLVYGALVVVCR